MNVTEKRYTPPTSPSKFKTPPKKSSDRAKYDRAFQQAAADNKASQEEGPKKRLCFDTKSAPEINFDFVRVQEGPPPTPAKKQRTENAYAKLFRQAQQGTITIGDKLNQITPLATGSFFAVYKLDEKRVIKIFNEKVSRESERQLEAYMESAIANYYEAKELGLPIAEIYNIETALKDKYFIQEYIPEQLDVTNKSHFEQLRTFFLTSLESKVIFDIKPGNILVRDKTAILVDFVEDKDDGLTVFINHAVREWCIKAIKEHKCDKLTFLADLTEGFEKFGHGKEQNDEILTRIFV
jgi:hypothetical protein